MKIGVVTYWYGKSNYGMILQCWATQQYLKKLGHEPYVIRYQPERPWYIRLVKWCLKYMMCLLLGSHRAALSQEKYNAIKDKARDFDDFRKAHLDFSERSYKSIRELRKNPPTADCYIAGSDQIWCSNLKSDNSWGYYLAFGDKKVKRIAYAPSFGKMVYPDNKQNLLSRALSGLNHISCRENFGVSICKKLGFNATKVEDPTLLLSKESYLPLCEKLDYKDYVFIYSVNIGAAEDIYWDAVKSTFKGEKVIVTPASGSIDGGELFGDEVSYAYATPGEWLSLINESRIVITSSFHGVVFSIIFNKKFAFVPLKGEFAKTNDRIYDLLQAIDLEELIIKMPEDYQRILDTCIDWVDINNKRSSLIEKSIHFINTALGA